jgi:hypothetical protein
MIVKIKIKRLRNSHAAGHFGKNGRHTNSSGQQNVGKKFSLYQCWWPGEYWCLLENIYS